MDKKVIYREVSLDNNKVELKDWVGEKVIDLFPLTPVYIENKMVSKRLLTNKDKQYILQADDTLYSGVRPHGGVLSDMGTNFITFSTAIVTLNFSKAYKRATEYWSKVGREISRFITPDINNPNNPNFEGDGRSNSPQITGFSNTVSSSLIPWIFGNTRMTPFYGQKTYSLVQDGGALQKLFQYFICGYDNFLITDEKLGETSLTDYSTDSITRRFAFGTTANLSNPSVIEVPKGEQLSYDKDKQVNQSSSLIYNEVVNNGSLTYNPSFEFRNVVITDFSTKTFTVEIDYYKNGNTSTILTATNDFVITDSDLVLVSGKTYTATDTYTEALLGGDVFTTILETRLFPASTTRVTSSEISQELECELDSEEVICGAFNQATVLNNPINQYTGVVSAVVDTSKDNTKEIDFNFSFPQGMFRQENDGSRATRSTKVDIQIKTQSGEYQDISDFNLHIRGIDGSKQNISTSSTTVSGSEVTFSSPDNIKIADELFYRTIGVTLPADKYTVRIRSADFSEKTNFDVGYPQVETISYWLNENAVNSQIFPSVVQINLEATATTELTGTVQQYNFLGRGQINIWNGTDWNDIAFSNNPAAVIRYALLNEKVNIRAESEDIIDNDSLVELYEFCEDEGFEVNGVISSETKIESFMGSILDNCQSTWTFSNGRFYFATDKDKQPRQLFTQHNTYNFRSSPNIGKNVTALRFTYLDQTDWLDREITVYWYDGAAHDMPKINTTDSDYRILKQSIDYVNDPDIVRKIAKYRLELIQAKRRNYTFSVNLEALDLQILDRILVSDTVNMEQSQTGQINEVITDSGNITGFRTITPIDIPANSTIVIRSLNTSTEQIEINSYEVANSGNSAIIELKTPIVNNGVIQGKGTRQGLEKYTTWDYDGDLFEIGAGKIITCTVDSITFNDTNFTATITAREA